MYMMGLLAQSAAVSLFIWIAICDFRTLKVRNRNLVVLIVIYVATLFIHSIASLPGDLVAGVVLFGIGFISWKLRVMGGGDVKLFFVLGLYLGFDGLGPFAVLLMVVSVLVYSVIRLVGRLAAPDTNGKFLGRIKAMGDDHKVPYAVVLIAAALPIIIANS